MCKSLVLGEEGDVCKKHFSELKSDFFPFFFPFLVSQPRLKVFFLVSIHPSLSWGKKKNNFVSCQTLGFDRENLTLEHRLLWYGLIIPYSSSTD